MKYETYKRVMEGLQETKFNFRSPTKLDIIRAVIIYRDFSGSKFGPANRSATIAITPEVAAEFDKYGYKYKELGVKDEEGNILEGMSVLAIQPKLRYRSGLTGNPVAFPPEVSYYNSNGVEVSLSEETVGALDTAKLSKCSFTINFYPKKDGSGFACSIKKFKSVMEPYVEYDGLYDEYNSAANEELNPVDDDQVPFDV